MSSPAYVDVVRKLEGLSIAELTDLKEVIDIVIQCRAPSAPPAPNPSPIHAQAVDAKPPPDEAWRHRGWQRGDRIPVAEEVPRYDQHANYNPARGEHPSPPAPEGILDGAHIKTDANLAFKGQKEATPMSLMMQNEDFVHKRGNVARVFLGKHKVDDKVLLVNKTDYQLIFVVSSDPHARKFKGGNFGAGMDGVEAGLELGDASVINTVMNLNPKAQSEVMCRTDHIYITVARTKTKGPTAGHIAVYRLRREVTKGSTYVVTPDMLKGNDVDIRPPSFLNDEFK